jgi:hypothetical protein
MEVKQFCDVIGWDKTEYSRKTRGLIKLTVEECGKAADILQGGAGFPFVDPELAAVLEGLKSRG